MSAQSQTTTPVFPASGIGQRLFRKLTALFWGVLFCQFAATAVLVVGWTYRLAQQRVFRRWAQTAASPAACQPWPRWFMADADQGGRFGALRANLRSGFATLINVWTVTLPGCGLLYLGWSSGWNVSFNRLYADIGQGPLTMLLGALLLIAALIYLPLAQMHQAAAGDWREFYRAGVVLRLIRQRPFANLAIALLYGLASLPLLLLTVLPGFLPQIVPQLDGLAPAEAAGFLQLYYLAAGLPLFLLFLLPRLAAARIYAGAVPAALRQGRIAAGELPERPRQFLAELGLLPAAPPAPRPAPALWRQGAYTAAGSFAASGLFLATAAVWSGFVFEIVVAQFFNYREAIGWLNHPLVQLPWLRFVPDLPAGF
ncbi:MAG: hypothetical protein ACKVOI_11875 [Dongiaceae bacterium]